jgi:hypothetical protein
MLDIASTRMLGQYGFLAKVRNLMIGALFPRGDAKSHLILHGICPCRYFQHLKTWAYRWMLWPPVKSVFP